MWENNRYLISNTTTDDDLDELIRTVEDLQTIIDGQKQDLRNMRKDNYNKDKEIGLFKLELKNIQKELDDKRLEYDKEIDDILKIIIYIYFVNYAVTCNKIIVLFIIFIFNNW